METAAFLIKAGTVGQRRAGALARWLRRRIRLP